MTFFLKQADNALFLHGVEFGKEVQVFCLLSQLSVTHTIDIATQEVVFGINADICTDFLGDDGIVTCQDFNRYAVSMER